jgi:hypothetical protein
LEDFDVLNDVQEGQPLKIASVKKIVGRAQRMDQSLEQRAPVIIAK